MPPSAPTRCSRRPLPTTTRRSATSALRLARGSGNVAIGSGAGAAVRNGSNNIEIANPGVATDANTIRIGTTANTAAYIGGIFNRNVSGAPRTVVVNASGKLGTQVAARPQQAELERDLASQAERIAELERQVRRLTER